MRRAAIFDLDGTLVDSMWAWKSLMIDFLDAHGIEAPDHVKSEVAHMSLTQSSAYVQQYFQLSMTPEEIYQEWTDMVYAAYSEKIELKPGAGEYLRVLKNKGILLGLATSCDSILCEACLKRNGIAQLFDAITYADEVGIGKSSPEIYLECLRRLTVKPQETVLFEDIITPLRCGAAIGMYTAAVEDSYAAADREQLMAEADWYIRDYRELLEGKQRIF